jgi:hypothetical protein
MMAEMRKKSAEEGDKAKPLDVDKELEQQIKAMDLSKAQKEQMIQLANDRSKELRKHIENMKEKLRQRKDRKKPGSLTADEEQNLSDEEKRKLLETREMQNDADRLDLLFQFFVNVKWFSFVAFFRALLPHLCHHFFLLFLKT